MSDLAHLSFQVDSSPLRRTAEELRAMGAAGQRASGDVKRASTIVNNAMLGIIGVAGGAAAAVAASFSVGAVVTEAKRLDSALREVSTLIEGTAGQMGYLESKARELSRTFGGSATAQAQAFYQAISAGATSVEDAAETLEVANKLAIGGITDVTTGVDILTTAMNVYAAEGLQASDASDALFVAMRAGKTDISQLANSLAAVLPLSETLGVSFDETAAATAALTKGGIATSEAVTGLRAALTAVLGPSAEAEKLADKLGINFSTAGIEAKGFAGFMEDVVEKTGGSASAIQTLFGSVEATTVALAFAGQSGEFLTEILGQMEEKAGETQSAFDKMSDSAEQRLSKALARLMDIGMTFGSVLLTVAVPALEAAASVMEAVASNADVIAISLGVLSASYIPTMIAGVTSAVVWLGTMEGMFIAGAVASRALTLAMKALPFVAAITAATLLYRGYRNLIEATGSFGGALNLLGQVAKGVWDGIRVSAQALEPALSAVWQNIRAGFFGMLEGLAGKWREFLGSVAGGMRSIPGMGDASLALNNMAIMAGSKVYEFQAAADEASTAAEDLTGKAQALASSGFDEARTAAGKLATAVMDSTSQVEGSVAAADQAAAAMGVDGGAAGAAGAMSGALDDVGGAAGRAAGGAGRLSEAARAAKQRLDDLRSAAEAWTDRTATPVEKYRKQLEELNAVAAAGLIGDETKARGLKALNLELADSTPLVGELIDTITGSMFDGFKATLDSITGFFKRWLGQLIATAAKNQIVMSMSINASGVGAMGGGLMGGAGGILGGLGSTLGGLGTAFMGGASGFLSTGFAGLGSTLAGATSSLTGLATAAGALALPIAGAVAAFDFFRTKTKTLDQGVRIATDGLSTAVQQWAEIRKSRFWGLSTSRSTDYTAADAAIADPLMQAVGQMQGGIMDAARALGVGRDAFRDFAYEIQLSTEGMSDDQALKALQKELTGLGDAFAGMVPGVASLRREGESTADALARTATALGTVNSAFRMLDFGQLEQSLAGGKIANRLVEMSGGLQEFSQATSYYFDNIMSAPDRLRALTRQFDEAMDAANISARPSTAAEFQSLVERLMDAGRSMAATAVINLAPLFESMTSLRDELAKVEGAAEDTSLALAKQARAAEIAAIRADQQAERERARDDRLREFSSLQDRLLQLQGRENEIRRRALEALHPSNRAMLERIYALEDLAAAEERATAAAEQMRAALDAALGNANELADGALSSLERAVGAQQEAIRSRITGLDEQRSRFSDLLSASESLADRLLSASDTIAQSMLTPSQARQQREAALATLRMVQASGGVVESSRALERAIDTLTGMDASGFSTELEMRRATAQAAYLTEAIGERALSDAEYYREAINGLDEQIALAERQIDKLDDQLELGRAQLDAARGIAQGVMSVAQAIAGLQSAIAGLKAAQAASAGVAGLDLFEYQSGLAAKAANGGALTNWQANELSEMQKAAKAVAGQTLYDYQQRILRNGINDMASLKPWERDEFKKLVPGFADGGFHTGGWRMVGERGPELEYTGPSRIYNNSQTNKMLDGRNDEVVAAVNGLRDDSRQQLGRIIALTDKRVKIAIREEIEKMREREEAKKKATA